MARTTKSEKIRPFWRVIIALVVVLILVWLLENTVGAPSHEIDKNQNTKSNQQKSDNESRPNFSLTKPTSIWVVVNKRNPINPKDFKPQLVVPDVTLKGSSKAENMHVSKQMAQHLEELFAAAAQAGYPLMLSSGFRSYQYQTQVYSRQVDAYGQQQADRVSARPGYSEHQTGLAADIASANGQCDLLQCFGSLPSGEWVATNAHLYGFVIRYPKGKENITGYTWEPWHLRYVGDYAAQQMHEAEILTLEKYFNTGPAPTYN